MKAIIVGGGIGGLTAALMLHARGIECEVYERSDAVRELGGGINTLPHAIKALKDLGLLERALAELHEQLDHHFLDEVEGLGPATLENLARWIWERLQPQFDGLARVTVLRDSSGDSCSYFGP